MRGAEIKQWPFEKPEFGNTDQIDWLRIENEKAQKLEEALKQDLEKVDTKYVEYVVLICPHCDEETEACEDEDDAFYELAEYVGEDEQNGGSVHICRSCKARIKL